jgi:hypothetical protein
MACPLDATTGFLQITGPITPSQLKPIELNAAPLTFQFAPRAVPPTLVGNVVEENPQNTLLYKSIRYGLADVQLTAPTHTGYNSIAPFLGTPAFEVNLTFFSNQAPKTYPAILLLVVPVYTAQEQYHATYFEQLLNTDATAVSIQSLFFDDEKDAVSKSFSYQTCIDLVGPGEEPPESLSARVFVFPFGASIGQQDATNLYNAASAGSGNVLPPYKLDKGLIGDYSTVLAYNVAADGEKVPSDLSAEGFVAQTPLSPVTEQFAHLLQYYTKAPLLAGTKALKDEQCGLPTEDYKCVPFNPTSDLSGNLVVLGQGQTLNQLLQKQQSEQQMGVTGSLMGSGGYIVVIIICSLVGAFITIPILLYGGAWILSKLFDFLEPPPAGAAAATVAAAGAVASALSTPPDSRRPSIHSLSGLSPPGSRGPSFSSSIGNGNGNNNSGSTASGVSTPNINNAYNALSVSSTT